jgi:hypothetical protein
MEFRVLGALELFAHEQGGAHPKPRASRTAAGDRCHSWPTLLRHLALRSRNTIRLAGAQASFTKLSEPTPAQARALELVQTAELPT